MADGGRVPHRKSADKSAHSKAQGRLPASSARRANPDRLPCSPMRNWILAIVALWTGTASADLLVAGYSSGRIYRFNERTGLYIDTFVPNPGGELNQPHGMAYGPDGNLYVASAANDRVLRYDGTNGTPRGTFVAAGSGGLDYPVWLEFRGDHLYVTSQLSDEVLRYNSATGAFADRFVSAAANGGLDGPSGMTWGPDGHLYVVGRFGNHVLRYDGTNGSFLALFVPSTAGLSQPFGCAFGPDGHLYVANGNNNRVSRFHGQTGTPLGHFTTGGLSLPIGLQFGPGGDLYVASFSANRIVRFNGTTGAFISNFAGAGAPDLAGPNFFAFHDFGPPRLTSITRQGTNVVVAWRGRADVLLQVAASGPTNWVNVGATQGQSAFTNSPIEPAMFYRLRQD